MSLVGLSDLIKNQKTYYSLEVYPPSSYDSDNIDIISNPIDKSVLDLILRYIKEEWIDSSIPLPLYAFCKWTTVDSDMMRLSEKFKDYTFVLFGRGEIFIDNVWNKIYSKGELVLYNKNIDYRMILKLTNGTERVVHKDKGIESDPNFDLKQYFPESNKSFMDCFNVATNLTSLLGGTVASVGTLVGGAVAEVALASQVIKIGVTLLEEMQTNLNNYGMNKGRCKHLAERCENIMVTLQNTPPESIKLQHVICVIDRLKTAKDLINEYIKRWRLTKFILSREYVQQFTACNQNLSDCFYDFAVNLQVINSNKKIGYKMN